MASAKKTNKAKEFRNKEDKELHFDIEKLRQELFDLRFKSTSEGIQNPSRIPTLRREIAKMQTVLRERQLKIRGQASK